MSEDKKEKNIKEEDKKNKKIVSKVLTKFYSNYYNNKKHSDITLKIGEEEIFAHKLILTANSKFFEGYEESSFTFPKEDDIKITKALVKYFYEGEFEYAKEDLIVFMLLSKKVLHIFYIYFFSMVLKIWMF
jgi:hypothetical protein